VQHLPAEAGIKTWMLTGDKLETAVNIAYATQMLTSDMTVEVGARPVPRPCRLPPPAPPSPRIHAIQHHSPHSPPMPIPGGLSSPSPAAGVPPLPPAPKRNRCTCVCAVVSFAGCT
jgi:magnesium-transporting ATPase (P-type)